MSELLAAPAIVFRGREEGYTAAVIKSRFLLYANGVAIQNPSKGCCVPAVRKLHDFRIGQRCEFS